MKVLNNFFIGIYTSVLVATAWFGINWSITRGVATMFDNATEFTFATLYIFAILFSIFMHYKLRNRQLSVSHRMCIVITLFNSVSLIGFVIKAFSRGASENGLFLAAWIFGVLVLWFFSLIFGVIALKKSNSIIATS